MTDFKGTLPLDYVNSRRLDSYSLVQGGSVSKLEDFGLIVDLASSEAELRNWIEQVASRTNVPVVAAVSQGLEPFARPYLGVPGAKLSAVMSGVAGREPVYAGSWSLRAKEAVRSTPRST